MKKSSKFLAVLLAVAMMVSMTMPAFALTTNDTAAFAVTDATVAVDGSEAKEVSISFVGAATDTYLSVEGTFALADTTNKITLTKLTPAYQENGNDAFVYVETGKFKYADTQLQGTEFEVNAPIVTATYTVPADTASGRYSVELTDVQVMDTSSNTVADATYTATITVNNTSEGGNQGDGYAATIANGTAAQTIRVDDTITVNIGANKAHSASQMTVTYDSALVRFESAASCTVNSETAGTLKLASYGAEKATTDYYVLTFTAIANGTAEFAITDAKFGTGTSAETASLEDATEPEALTVTIEKKQYSVDLDEIFTGAEVAIDGETYTFQPETATGAHYEYTLPTATMNNVAASVTGDATNGWSIANVNGPLVINGTRTGKTQTVTINTVFGESTTTQTATATYATPYTFTVSADETIDGVFYSYALSSVKIGGVIYNGYSAEEGTKNYTIPGDAITGAIEITITKSNKFNVAISGDGAGQVTADPVQVAPGENVTLTLTPETGYTYVVKVNGSEVTLTDNKYTINNVQSVADVTVTVEKNLTMTYANVSNYLQVDGSRFWLVKIAPTDPANTDISAQIAGHTYTYNGSNMYWSSAYNAYVTLVVAETSPELTAANFNIIQVDAIPTVTYDMNVNMSADGVVDPADAQLVWNMYSVKYNDFTTSVTMEKFMKADVNGDGKVDVNDAAAIIRSSHVLDLPETNN